MQHQNKQVTTATNSVAVSNGTPTKQARPTQTIKFAVRPPKAKNKAANKKKELFISASWFIGGDIYLISYAFDLLNYGTLSGSQLTRTNVLNLLKKADTIFVYGCDTGIIEKHFNMEVRGNYNVVNCLKLFRDLLPWWYTSMQLTDLFKQFGIEKKTEKNESTIWEILRNWSNPQTRKKEIEFSVDEIICFVRLQRTIANKYHITKSNLKQYFLK
jgi:hypothetical protein